MTNLHDSAQIVPPLSRASDANYQILSVSRATFEPDRRVTKRS